MADQILTQDYLKQLFDYKDGHLFWKSKPSNNVDISKPAGTIDNRGYKLTRVNKVLYQNHRLIFLYHYGYFPTYIDHKDGNSLNNNIDNLRKCNLFENAQNAKIRKDNISNCKGVSWDKNAKKWSVKLQTYGNIKYFGIYADLELAELVATEARNKYHKEFSRHF